MFGQYQSERRNFGNIVPEAVHYILVSHVLSNVDAECLRALTGTTAIGLKLTFFDRSICKSHATIGLRMSDTTLKLTDLAFRYRHRNTRPKEC